MTAMLRGYIDVATRDEVAGWAIDVTCPENPLPIRVVVNGEEKFRGPADRPRPDLVKLYGNENHGFRFAFENRLPANQLCQIAIYGSQNSEIIAIQTLPPIRDSQDNDGRLQPAFVSFAGRSGSTILMKMLSTSQDIVVAGAYPFEIMLSAYYAHAFSVITRPGDHERSSNPSNVWEDMFRVGANPFYHQQYSNVLVDQSALYDILGRRAKDRISGAFRDTVTDIYQALAGAKPTPSARYFAEKCTLHNPIREAVRCIFDNPKEIVLIRDIRDIYCSSRSFWSVGASFLDRINAIKASYLEIKRERDPTILIVRYEDLVLEREKTAQSIAKFLGLSKLLELDAESEDDLFRRHGTSADARASVGRWKRDLSTEEKGLFVGRFDDFFKAYGYEI